MRVNGSLWRNVGRDAVVAKVCEGKATVRRILYDDENQPNVPRANTRGYYTGNKSMRSPTLPTSDSWAAGGVDGAIHRAGGAAIAAECSAIRAKQGGCPTGQAVITTGGNLPAKHVIHTVGPIWRGGTAGEAELLASCYRESLRLAVEHGIKTIAFPSISTGVYGYPVAQAAVIALNAIRQFLKAHDGLDEVRFVLFDDATYGAYENALLDMGV